MDFYARRKADGWENPYQIATLATQRAFRRELLSSMMFQRVI